MSDDSDLRDDGRDDDLDAAHDVLEAFNAEEVVERPGRPPVEPPSTAVDADIQPPQ